MSAATEFEVDDGDGFVLFKIEVFFSAVQCHG